MATAAGLTTAAANGNEKLVKSLVEKGEDMNGYSAEGFRPLCIAAFWGYSNVVQLLLKHGADVNVQNRGSRWTALHCSSFQGHGKVIMHLMNQKPDLSLKDNHGRTAADFASALDAIWPFFAAAGCKRTPKDQLIKMDIVKKVTSSEEKVPQLDKTHFSRPGSAYVMKSQSLYAGQHESHEQALQSSDGDILVMSDLQNNKCSSTTVPSFSAWRN